MLIGIDASKTAIKEKTGIDNTAYQIIFNLEKIDQKNTYYLYSNKPINSQLKQRDNFQEKLIPFPKFWNRLRLPLALLRDKPEKFLQLTNVIPSFAPPKTAVLIHDLAFKFFPEAYSSFELILQETAIKSAIEKAELIIFSCNANKKDFLKYYQFPENKIRIVPLAYDDATFKKKGDDKNILTDSSYFIFVGRLEKRKNLIQIIEAFGNFKDKTKSNYKLMLVGKKGYGYDEIENKIKNSKHKKDIVITGYLSNEKLADLYRMACGLIYPSLYEGFGLPILEAMACGIPVITSDIPTLKEISGDAALLVDPQNTKSIVEEMEKIAFDKKKRLELISKGLERIKYFSWAKTANQIYKVLEEM